MSIIKPMGIYSLEVLDCGCKLKRYCSGVTVIDSEDRNLQCTNPKHIDFKEYECRVCGEKFDGKTPLQEHRWSHAV